MEGWLSTEGGRRYPIRAGVPRLLPEDVSKGQQQTVDAFADNWAAFDFIADRYEAQLLGWIGPNRPESFLGQVVLEGGCGKGRHSMLMAKWGAKEVLSVDLGASADVAFRNCREVDRVHVIQADLFHLPIRPGVVDTAFSVGVLHHTPDPQRAFSKLKATVRPGGRVIAWVYGRENNGWIIHGVNPVREHITSKLPHSWVVQLSKAPTALLLALGRGVYKPLSKPGRERWAERLFYREYLTHIADFPFEEVHSIVVDHLIPELAEYTRREDFERWFTDEGLEQLQISWYNENSWRGTGIVPG